MTETNVLEVTIVDAENYERTFKLDNPKDNLTMAQIQAAFADAIEGEWWVVASGAKAVMVARATVTVTTKTKIL